jgi:hypothetical protein
MPRLRGTSRSQTSPAQPPGPIAPHCIKASEDCSRCNNRLVLIWRASQRMRHASGRRSSGRRRCPTGIANPPFPLLMGRREKSAQPLALGATYENISTSMTRTKCITRGPKGFKRAHSTCQKCSKGPNWVRLCLLSEDNSTAHNRFRSTRRLKIPAKTTTDPSFMQHFCSIENKNF